LSPIVSITRAFVVAALLQSAGSTARGDTDGWEPNGAADGVTMWKRKHQDSEIYAMKGQKVFRQPISKIISAIEDEDLEQKKRWIDMIAEFKMISKPGDPLGMAYEYFNMPWPTQDRDLVVVGKRTIDREKRQVFFDVSSVEHPDYPPGSNKRVRMELTLNRFTMTMLDDQTTDVTVEVHMDPKGWLPSWLVNLINRRWPKNTLNALEREVGNPATRHDPLMIEYFYGGRLPEETIAH